MGIVTGGSQGNDIVINTIVLDNASKPIQLITKRIEELDGRTRRITNTISRLQVEANKTTNTLEKTSRTLEEGGQRFKFTGLTYLFFGMFLERTFGRIQSSAIETFRDITESTYGAQTAFTALAASGEFLKFTIGDALNTILEPLIPIILQIVEAIADFIQQHPGIALIVTAITAAGIAMSTFGAILVFVQNVQIAGLLKGLLATQASLAATTVEATTAGTAMKGLGGITIGPNVPTVLGIIGLIALVIALTAEIERSDKALRKLLSAPPGGTPGAPRSQILAERRAQGEPMLTTPFSKEEQDEYLRRLFPPPAPEAKNASGFALGNLPMGNFTIQRIDINTTGGNATEIAKDLKDAILKEISQSSSTTSLIR